MQMKFPRETDARLEQVLSQEMLSEVREKILNMTSQDEDYDLPSTRGIEMVLLALEELPRVVAAGAVTK